MSWTISGAERLVRINTTGLVLYLDPAMSVSYPGSGTAWTDLSGSNNNATLVNGPTFNSANGGILQFDGSNDHATVGASSTLTPSSVTFSMWVKRTGTWASGACLFWAKPNGVFDGNGFYVEPLTTGANVVTVTTNGANVNNFSAANTSSVFALNTFINFAFTMTPGARQIYINGLPVTTTVAGTPAITDNTATKYLMHNSPAYGNYTAGEVGQVAMYSRALTAAEILDNFTISRTRYSV